jgi:hypothetical protein
MQRRPEIRVYCGGLRPPAQAADSALVLDTRAPPGSPGRVNLNLGPLTRKMVANVPPRLADLLEIASYVYCADQFSRRETTIMRDLGTAWRRTFCFEVPVRDLMFWSQSDVQNALFDLLGFLSEDAYAFRFHRTDRDERELDAYLDLGAETETSDVASAAPRFTPNRIILFSGGLDSFAGAAETLLAKGERAVLVSHQSAALVRSRQADLVHALRRHTGQG